MDVRSLAFQTDLMIRGISGSTVEDRGDHLIIRTPTNPGYHWGNFIVVGEDAADAPRWLEAFRAAHLRAAHVAISGSTPRMGFDASMRDAYEKVGLVLDVSEAS